MKISTKGRYGLRALVDLAAYSELKHIPLSVIADRQNISINYLEQVFAILRKAGYIKSIKGAQGGYKLQKEPNQIIIGEVLKVLEGDLKIIDETTMEQISVVERCLNENVWEPFNNVIEEFVSNITLQDLIIKYKIMDKSLTSMYYI